MVRHSAEAYFLSDRHTLGSLRQVCDQLELDTGWLRRRLLEMAKKAAHPRPARKTIEFFSPQPATVGGYRPRSRLLFTSGCAFNEESA
jgi:hypothetical protein